nr:translation initiation factor IF-2-like [Aegilops tauschii subsp. strangulata]
MPTPRSRTATERRRHCGCRSSPRVPPIHSPLQPTTKPATRGRRQPSRRGRPENAEVAVFKSRSMLTADAPPARPSPAAGTISTTSPGRQGGVPSPEEAAARTCAAQTGGPAATPPAPPAAGHGRGGRPWSRPPAAPATRRAAGAPDLARPDGCGTTRDRGRRAARGGPARDAANHVRRRSEPPSPHRCTPRQCSASTRPGRPAPAEGSRGEGKRGPAAAEASRALPAGPCRRRRGEEEGGRARRAGG